MKTLVLDGKISRAVREGLELRQKLLVDGMPETEADRIIGQGLKAAWGDSIGQNTRSPWAYYCYPCKDTGWIEIEPDRHRLRRLYGEGGHVPAFYRKCEPCHWQDRERDLRAKQKA
jgi:hypothetical protein